MVDNLESEPAESIEDLFYAESEPNTPTEEATKAEPEEESEGEEVEAKEAEGQSETEDESEEEALVFDQPNDFAKYDYNEESKLYSFKSNGKKIEANVETLINRFQADQKLTQELEKIAGERKGLWSGKEAERLKDLEAEKARYEELNSLLDQSIEKEESDLEELRELDPTEYLLKKEQLEDKRKAKAKADSDIIKQKEAQREQTLQSESQKLLKIMGDDWKDPEAKQADLELMYKQAYSAGVTEEEAGQILDHRFWLLALKAAKFDQLQSKKLETKRVVKTPKVVKSQRVERQSDDELSTEELFYGKN